jgi:hypothetical protein
LWRKAGIPSLLRNEQKVSAGEGFCACNVRSHNDGYGMFAIEMPGKVVLARTSARSSFRPKIESQQKWVLLNELAMVGGILLLESLCGIEPDEAKRLRQEGVV